MSSHFILPAQPPLYDCPSIHVGSGLFDDPVQFARSQLYDRGKNVATFAAQQLTNHPILKAVLGVATGPLIDIAVGHYPELEKRKRQREKKEEDGTGVGSSRAIVAKGRRVVRNPKVRQFLGDAHNEIASRAVDNLANRFSQFELEKRAQFKRNKYKPARRRTT